MAFNELYTYLTSNDLLYEIQYRFRKHHSTELAALEFTDRIKKEMDAKKIPFSISLDISKAFDTLDHSVLYNENDDDKKHLTYKRLNVNVHNSKWKQYIYIYIYISVGH